MNPLLALNYDIRRRYYCPCKKGEWLYEATDNDWGERPKSEQHTMLCPECKDKYEYDRRRLNTMLDRGGMERGWA